MMFLVQGESVNLQDSSKSAGYSLNPNELKISIELNSGSIEFNLAKKPNSDSQALVVLRTNGVHSPWNEQRTGVICFASYN